MSLKFQLPSQKGAELLLTPTRIPAVLRVFGVSTKEGLALVAAYEGVIRAFHLAQAQNYSLSIGALASKVFRISDELSLQYVNQFGQEIINVYAAPTAAPATAPTKPPVADPLKIPDGYIAISNVNEAKDDTFDVYLNGVNLGTIYFDRDVSDTYVWYFGKSAPYLDQLDIKPPNPAGLLKYPHRQYVLAREVKDLPLTYLRREGSNTLEMRNIRTNQNSNYGLVWAGFFQLTDEPRFAEVEGVRRQVFDTPWTFQAEYSGSDNQSFSFTIDFTQASTPIA